MNKGTVTLGAAIGGTIGAYVPVWLHVDNGFGVWSIIGGLIGGILGIMLVVWLVRRFVG